jgi:hypothetical protein
MGQPSNTLYYGDNLDILRRYYFDPPFNANADYSVLFAENGGMNVSQPPRSQSETSIAEWTVNLDWGIPGA